MIIYLSKETFVDKLKEFMNNHEDHEFHFDVLYNTLDGLNDPEYYEDVLANESIFYGDRELTNEDNSGYINLYHYEEFVDYDYTINLITYGLYLCYLIN